MPYLTTTEAAARLNVTPDYIRQLVQRGLLEAMKLPYGPSGGVLVIDQHEVERYAVHRRPRGRPKGSTKRRRRSRAA